MLLPNVEWNDERGLLDIAIDPKFEDNKYFYLYYSTVDPGQFRVSRFRHVENGGGMTSRGAIDEEVVIW